jgi:hypothetical protein
MLNTAGAPRPSGSRFTGPLVPGSVDGLGERWTTAETADALELLRFRAEVATAPGFEEALRARVGALTAFTDPAFAPVREVVQDGEYLTLVTSRVAGQKLPEVLTRVPKGKRIAFVTRLLREATRALSALETVGTGVTHGAITADRILVLPDGRICFTEHVLGSAMQELALWPEELWTEFGLLARADEDGEAVFDQRTTVMQLAMVALSVLLSRQLTLHDFEHNLSTLLEEFSGLPSSASSPVAAPLRDWLQQALQQGVSNYASASEADAGLRNLLTALGPAGTAQVDSFELRGRTEPAGDKPTEKPAAAPPSRPKVHERQTPPAPVAAKVVTAPVTVPPPASVPEVLPEPRPWPRSELQTIPEQADDWTGTPSRSRREQYLLWAVIAVAVVAVGEAIWVARLVTRQPTVVLSDSSFTVESSQPGYTVMVDGKPVGSTPLKVRVNPRTQGIRLVAATPAAPVVDSAAAAARAESERTAAALDQAAARQRTGGLQIRTPINLTVLEGDRVLGSTADGPIVASAGSHQLDLVNTALGFRVRQNVTIRAGVITPMTITPPMGRISINAQPWAQVLIDDTAVGETPLANIQVPIGDHQITFRHPQMGERRERVTVRADTPARVSTTFQR